MKVLTGYESKAVALAIDPKNLEKRIVCPLCKRAEISVEKVDQPGTNRFSLMVSCPSCQMLTHLTFSGDSE